ncbi:unnamed protein product [Allacma fusca]|uniref:Uncharacterized protein n=1 Tax=Allacma fusca TaxID=39272 RepID=A0A8J2JJ70_9HEXA|nr:unnamed protein product [Allacma fusca]
MKTCITLVILVAVAVVAVSAGHKGGKGKHGMMHQKCKDKEVDFSKVKEHFKGCKPKSHDGDKKKMMQEASMCMLKAQGIMEDGKFNEDNCMETMKKLLGENANMVGNVCTNCKDEPMDNLMMCMMKEWKQSCHNGGQKPAEPEEDD